MLQEEGDKLISSAIMLVVTTSPIAMGMASSPETPVCPYHSQEGNARDKQGI